MAQKTVVTVVDDISGDPLAAGRGQTVRFGLDGQDYEIDLSAQNAAELREVFRRYVHAGRRVRRADGQRDTSRRDTTPVTQQRPYPRSPDTATIREWARTHGHPVSDRGRIPNRVLEAYAARH